MVYVLISLPDAAHTWITVLEEFVCSTVAEMLKCTLARGSLALDLPQISQSRGHQDEAFVPRVDSATVSEITQPPVFLS